MASAVTLFATERQPALADVVGREHRLDLGDGIGLAHLEEAEFGVGVGDQVIDQFIEQRAGVAGLDLRLLAQCVEVAGKHQFSQLGDDAGAALAILVLAVKQDALQRLACRTGLGAIDVFLDLQVEGQFDIEALAFGQADDGAATAIRTAQDALGLGEHLVVVAERGHHLQASVDGWHASTARRRGSD